MGSYVPAWVSAERLQVEEEIRDAFAGVTRKGGVSWGQAKVRDDYGSLEEEESARRRDGDKEWDDLVEDRAWEPNSSTGGFSFLDAIGFRYYLPAAMIRSLRTGLDEGIAFHLSAYPERQGNENWEILSIAQTRSVARFLRHMVTTSDDFWHDAYASHWQAVDAKMTQEQIALAFHSEEEPKLHPLPTELQYFVNRDWQEIPASIEEMTWGAFLLLPPDALAFHLPGLLIAALDQGHGELSESIQDALDSDWSDLAPQLSALLTHEQHAAVWDYLRVIEAWSDPKDLHVQASPRTDSAGISTSHR
jgi:hypothetical protein